jgi:Tfp pilus assembly protein PilF
MKLLLILTGGIVFLSGCENMKTKPDEMENAENLRRNSGHYQTAETDYQAGQLTQAKQGFESALKHDPTDIDSQFRLGNIALRNNQLDQAKQHYEAVLKQNRRHAKSHYNLGVINLMQAERSFQYFTATTTQGNIQPGLLKLLENINRFSNNQKEGITKVITSSPTSHESSSEKMPQQIKTTKQTSSHSSSLERLTDLLSDDAAQ